MAFEAQPISDHWDGATERLYCCVLAPMAGRFKGLRDGQLYRRNERNVAFRAAGPNWEGKVNWIPPLTGPNTIRRSKLPQSGT